MRVRRKEMGAMAAARVGATRRRMLAWGVRWGAISLALPFAAACASSAPAGPAGGPGTAGPSSESGRIVHWYTAQFPFHEDVGADLVKEFKAQYPKIEYVNEMVVGDRFQKLIAAAA